MQKEKDISCLDIDRHCSDPDETISREFNRQIDLKCDDDDSNSLPDVVDDDCDQNEEENDDFTFMFVEGGEQVLEDDQIRPVFPLFDQKLLFDDGYEVEEIDRLPIQPPVDKIFIQSPRGFTLPTEENHTGPYCAWSKQSPTTTATATAELISKKSNSTGFSKLWRLKEKGGRSNSYGRDAFVFLKSSDNRKTTTATTASSSSKPTTVEGGKARVVKAKRATVSAHEAYLKSRGGHTEEERRRSYLPYRPELMGFFTNVHGGLTKNVHPY